MGRGLIVAGVVIRIALSSALPLLSARGARCVARLTVASIVSGTISVLPGFQRPILLRIRRCPGIKGPGLLIVIPQPPFYQSVAQILNVRI